MTSPAAAIAPVADTKTLLIDAGERLIALRGLDGVTIKEITRAAGQRNESALQYHFGGLNGLMEAIVQRRTRAIDGLRNAHIDRLEAAGALNDARALAGCVVYPMIDLIRAADGESHYVRFVHNAMARRDSETLVSIWRENNRGMRRVYRAMRDLLSGLPPKVAALRYEFAVSGATAGMAYVEARFDGAATGADEASFRLECENLIDMVAAGIKAPASPEALRFA